MIVNLKEAIANGLKCSPGKSKEELNDGGGAPDAVPGLYVEVRATRPGVGKAYLRYKDAKGVCRHQALGTVGAPGDASLSEIRKRARTLKSDIMVNGADPRGEERARKEVISVEQLFTQVYYPQALKTKRSASRDEELYRLRIRDAFGNQRLNQLSRYAIVQWHAALPEQGISKGTSDHALKLLRHMINVAIDLEFFHDKNPAARVKLFDLDSRKQTLPSEDELARLLDILRSDENRTVCQVILMLMACGGRANEVLSMRWADVDLERKNWTVPEGSSKSRRSFDRPLSDSAIELLSGIDSRGKHEYVFVSKRTGQRLYCIRKAWLRLVREAKIDKKLRLHDLRHQFASALVNAGHSLYTVQKLLSHASPITSQRYSTIADSTLRAASNTVANVLKLSVAPVPCEPDDVSSTDSVVPQAA